MTYKYFDMKKFIENILGLEAWNAMRQYIVMHLQSFK